MHLFFNYFSMHSAVAFILLKNFSSHPIKLPPPLVLQLCVCGCQVMSKQAALNLYTLDKDLTRTDHIHSILRRSMRVGRARAYIYTHTYTGPSVRVASVFRAMFASYCQSSKNETNIRHHFIFHRIPKLFEKFHRALAMTSVCSFCSTTAPNTRGNWHGSTCHSHKCHSSVTLSLPHTGIESLQHSRQNETGERMGI
jgi:hypothetical protein